MIVDVTVIYLDVYEILIDRSASEMLMSDIYPQRLTMTFALGSR